MGKPRNYLTLETFQLNDNLWQEELGRVREIYRLFLPILSRFASKKIQVNYVRSASLPIKPVIKAEQVQQHQLPDKVDVYYANSNFLKSKGFKLPDIALKSYFNASQ